MIALRVSRSRVWVVPAKHGRLQPTIWDMDRIVVSLLPRAADLRRGERRILAALVSVLLAALVVLALATLAPGSLPASFRDHWTPSVVVVLAALIIGLRAVHAETKLLKLVLFARGGAKPRRQMRAIIDACTVTCAVSAAGAELVLGAPGPHLHGASITLGADLVYLICDALLVALLLGGLSVRGWRFDRMWVLLSAGYALLAVAGLIYAAEAARAIGRPAPELRLIGLTAAALLAGAVWQQQHDEVSLPADPVAGTRVPAVFAAGALVLLLSNRFCELNVVAWCFAVAAVLAAIARRMLVYRDARALARSKLHSDVDGLTGLPNRRGFIHRMHRRVCAAAGSNVSLALLVIDLDNFRQLNDTLGHEAGDGLLQMIGPRLQRVLRRSDLLGRLGGDEFAVLLGNAAESDTGKQLAQELRSVMERPFIVAGLPLRVTASIGIARYPEDGRDVQDLLKHAEVALYEAKSTRSGFARYSSARDTHSRERLTVAHDLAQAIRHRQLDIHFQAQATPVGVVRSAEALVRWRRADGQIVPPERFLPVAEQAGLSRDLTRYVLGAALDELRSWRDRDDGATVSVNTTVSDLLDEAFPKEVEAALTMRKLPARSLVLEITETSVLTDPVRIGAVLARLHALGVELSLDDFGTGFSSLEHLRFLPVSELKLDRSFVGRMAVDPADAAIVQATALLARELGLRLVAEGVEDAGTWETLAGLGCDLLQGYGVSRPLPPAAFRALLGGARDRTGWSPREWALGHAPRGAAGVPARARRLPEPGPLS